MSTNFKILKSSCLGALEPCLNEKILMPTYLLQMDERLAVLVVDDEPDGFEVIEAHLYREGYDLFYAKSGTEALNQLDSIRPDVILLDVMMPQMDGIEVTHRLKSDPHWQHIPIIIVTALSSKDDLARAINAGADDFLAKPVSGIELRARVRSMLRIKQQYDALEATLHLREKLSRMLVHDLRNPLTNIILSSNLLLLSGLEGKNLERLKITLNSARELNFMINDLLMLAKMQSGKMILNKVEVNLNELIPQVLSEFEIIAEQKNIHLVSKLVHPSRCITLDSNLFHRVLENLISNAIKFSPHESQVIVQLDYPDEQVTSSLPAQVIIRVIDFGAGIPEDQRQRIFEQYEVGQAINGITQVGLGLTFCKMVVEAHGGMIFVEENKPQGSIFTVVL